MNYQMNIIFDFEFEHFQERELFMDQCQDFIQYQIEIITDLHIKIIYSDWEQAESFEEFTKDFNFTFAG